MRKPTIDNSNAYTDGSEFPQYQVPPSVNDVLAMPGLRGLLFLQIPIRLVLDPRLNDNDRKIMACVLMHANRGEDCFLSNATLGAILQRGETAIHDSLRKLKELGLIIVQMERRPGATIRHIYSRVVTLDMVGTEPHTPGPLGSVTPGPLVNEYIPGIELPSEAIPLDTDVPSAAPVDRPPLVRTRTAPVPPAPMSRGMATLRASLPPRPQPKASPANPLVEYWNLQKGVRHHADPSTAVYKRAVRHLKKIQADGFASFLFDPTWLTKNQIKTPHRTKPMTEARLRTAMERLAKSFTPGFFPGPDSPLKNMPLDELIYNPRKQNSWLLRYMFQEPEEARDQAGADPLACVSAEDRPRAQAIADALQEVILGCRGLAGSSRARLGAAEYAATCKIATDIIRYYDDIPWDAARNGRCPLNDVFKNGAVSMGVAYGEYVAERYDSWTALSPNVLRVGGGAWDAWVGGLQDELGMDFATGRDLRGAR